MTSSLHVQAVIPARRCAQAIPYQDRIIGVGLSSSEKGYPNIAYKEVYAAAIEAGFLPTAHAGGDHRPLSGLRFQGEGHMFNSQGLSSPSGTWR